MRVTEQCVKMIALHFAFMVAQLHVLALSKGILRVLMVSFNPSRWMLW